jgi:DNA-binding transcriptional regulator YiaG
MKKPTHLRIVNEDYEDLLEEMTGPMYDDRETFIKVMEPKWKEQGNLCKELRESWFYTVKELAEDLSVSETTLRKFESGKPVIHAKLLGRTYFYFFELYKVKIEQLS